MTVDTANLRQQIVVGSCVDCAPMDALLLCRQEISLDAQIMINRLSRNTYPNVLPPVSVST